MPVEEGSGTSSAALRRARRLERTTAQSHTSLAALGAALGGHNSASERCVVGVVMAYACLLLLSGAARVAEAVCPSAHLPLALIEPMWTPLPQLRWCFS